MAGGSAAKRKGKAGEAEVAKFLTESFNSPFCRVPNSGAFTGGKNVYRINQLDIHQRTLFKGDILVPDDFTKMVIEMKFYSDFPFHTLLSTKNIPLLDTWLAQTQHSLESGDMWFLVFKINRKSTYVVLNKDLANTMSIGHHSIYLDKYIVTDFYELIRNNMDILRKYAKEGFYYPNPQPVITL